MEEVMGDAHSEAEPEGELSDEEDHGYTIPPPPDDRPQVETAFLVYVTEDGKAIATSEITETLEQVRIKREATHDDLLRAALEVTEDIRRMLQTQMTIQMQMSMARQMGEQAKNQAVANGLDLSKMRSKP